jgi:mono/diheme cytochrome c family protein
MNKLGIACLLALSTALATSSLHAADAAALYNKNCALCHAKDGSGNTMQGKKNKARDFRDAKVQAEFNDAKMAQTIKEGVHEGSKERMDAFGEKFSAEEINALVAYVRGLKK